MSDNSLQRPFLSDESGAVTADWVPLVSAGVGLGLAVIGVVSGGVESLSRSINAALNGDIVGAEAGAGDGAEETGEEGGDQTNLIQIALDTFTGDSNDGWVVLANEHDDPLLDDMLGPFFDQSGNQVISSNYSFDPDTGYAMFEFDLTTIGNWEAADEMRIFVNGVMIDATRLAGGSANSVSDDGDASTIVSYNFIERESVSRSVREERLEIADAYYDEMVGDSNYESTRSNVNTQTTYTVQVVVENPGEDMQLGMGRIGDDPYGGEAWAVDNVGSYGADVLPVEFGGEG